MGMEAMGKLGEIKKAREVGHKGTDRYIWHACEGCGKERWVIFRKNNPTNLRCPKCRHIGSLHPSWKGGRYKDREGYIEIWVPTDDFFASMRNKDNYIREHRLIMARHLGRCLHHWELVHHKNHIKDDNRLENLQIIQEMQHNQLTVMENRIAYLEQRVTILEAENILLKDKLVTAE